VSPVADEIHQVQFVRLGYRSSRRQLCTRYFESQGLFKYDFNGALIWKMSLGPIIGRWASVSGVSPVLFEDKNHHSGDQDEGENSSSQPSTKDGKSPWKVPAQAQVPGRCR